MTRPTPRSRPLPNRAFLSPNRLAWWEAPMEPPLPGVLGLARFQLLHAAMISLPSTGADPGQSMGLHYVNRLKPHDGIHAALLAWIERQAPEFWRGCPGTRVDKIKVLSDALRHYYRAGLPQYGKEMLRGSRIRIEPGGQTILPFPIGQAK